jgi:hypothetical protein
MWAEAKGDTAVDEETVEGLVGFFKDLLNFCPSSCDLEA